MMFVGDFQKFLPVGDIPLHEEGGNGNNFLECIEYVVQLVQSHLNNQEEDDNDPPQRDFQRCLINFQQDTLYEQDWQTLQS